MNGDAFWYKNGKVKEVNNYHISDIIGDAEAFGLTRKEIEEIYKKHNERFGTEGKAREEIMKKVMENGWIRVRQYISQGGARWTINFHSFTKQKKDIQNMISYFLLDKKTMKKTDVVDLASMDGKYAERFDGFMGTSIMSLIEGKKVKKVELVEEYKYFDY